MPARSAALGVRPVHLLATVADRASGDHLQPEGGAYQFRLAAAHEPGDAHHLAGAHVDRGLLDQSGGQRQPIRFKQYCARRTADLREQRLDRAAGHQLDQCTIAHVTRRAPS